MISLVSWIFLIHPLICFAELNDIMDHPNWELLNYDRCGLSNADRIIGGTDAAIGAYPWLARIGYVPRYMEWMPLIFECGGAVINKFYIITAAHCVSNVPNNMIPVRIRLGEHNTETNPDCDDTFCNDPYEDYSISEIIVHENWYTAKLKNDIALFRVDNEITFTEFIAPICMTKNQLLEKDFVGQIAEVAGWGFIDPRKQVTSKILQTVKLPIHQVSDCSQRRQYQNYSIDSNQMCVGGRIGEDSCGGDSGGPLMKVEAGIQPGPPRYYIIGLVSFGLRYCGESDTPGIYTDMSKYLPWVLDHLRP